ncbi:hypothetical protein K402DRAFT_459275 [Aulographum hederae CBS 113979]|uniref:Uncharacterized protein n=1 Tax=Aulographum hederae CBS 113979 TaxID=1176131 RepID=A0A6G1HG93_9PEZI|nr:hypothetical protein K402DRAFT_459275 [Aulographum hederae CBS 113979]
MSLQKNYEQFLASPTTAALAEGSSIIYVPTLTTINEPTAILKHLAVQAKFLTKKSDKLLNAIESAAGLCLEVETTLEFVNGGGAYLPGLDDNFLADRIVTFPVVHIVSFDNQQKITSARLHWDQGALLKQVEVIGARGKNWPIRDGREQAKLIASSVAKQPTSDASRPSTAQESVSGSSRGRGRSHASSTTSATGDPHATLNLFQPREVDTDVPVHYGTSVPTRASARPASRDLGDILAGQNNQAVPRSPSPTKGGAGKHFRSNRLFEEGEDPEAESSPLKEVGVKTNANKYNHFEFGDGQDGPNHEEQVAADKKKSKKHLSQWDFADFTTPEKLPMKVRSQDVRHFGWEDDVVESPVKRPIVHQPRPNLEAQFEFVDDGSPEGQRRQVPSKSANSSLGLYRDHVIGDDDADDTSITKQPLADAKNINNKDRSKTFGSQFVITDKSPAAVRTQGGDHEKENSDKMGGNRKKVLEGLDAHWGLYEDAPATEARPEHMVGGRGIKTSGDGMGGRKSGGRSWGFGDDSADEAERNAPIVKRGDGKGSRAQTEAAHGGFWDF